MEIEVSWWTSGDENGHWVLIVSKEEFQIGVDVWGFRVGELKELALSLVPASPQIATAAEIAAQLWRGADKHPQEFLKAIQRCLRELRLASAAQSAPAGRGSQLGWRLPRAPLAVLTELPPAPCAESIEDVPHSKPLADVLEHPRVSLQRKVLSHLPAAPNSISASLLSELINRDRQMAPKEALKMVQAQLRELQLKKLVCAIRGDGEARLGWHLA